MVDLSLTSCQDTVTCDPEIAIFSGKHIPNIACDPRIIAGKILIGTCVTYMR